MKLSLSEIHNTGELFLQNDSSADNAFGSLIASNGRAPIRQATSSDLKALNAELNCKSESLAARERAGNGREEKESGGGDGKAFLTTPLTPLPSAWAPAAPSALAISEAWLDDRAPDGGVVSGSSRAFTIDWEQQRRGLLSHQGSLVQISNGNREAAALCTLTKKKTKTQV